MSNFKITVQLDMDQVESVILQELKNVLEMELNPYTYEDGTPIEVDMEMVQALITVIKFYMTPKETAEFDKYITDKLQSICQEE